MRSLASIAVLVLAVGLLPLFVSSGVTLGFVTMVLYATLLGQAWNILGGFGGQFSFGHAVFFGTGAYAMAVLQMRFGLNAWAALPCAIALGGVAGTLLGALSFRYGLRGSYFALVTLAFAEVFRILANTFDFTGAGVGLQLPLQEGAAQLQFATETGYLYLALALATVSLLFAWWLKHSRYGAWLAAVRDNEDSAAALGVNAFRVKLVAITVSGALMAAGGAFYVQKFHYIDPHLAYGAPISVEALLSAIIGGMGTVFGPLLGAVVLHGLGELTRNSLSSTPGASLVIYGALLVLIIMFMPRGIAGLFEGKR
ncbi:MAG: putative high-affinity branched-chain amino acid transporter, permease protein [Betaproteobacteria bacterium]|nr:putative high-affinity branched-chain amino acid transporter, permease protein [Betaproteobacteria bacterium]